jgi:hypothetical protein
MDSSRKVCLYTTLRIYLSLIAFMIQVLRIVSYGLLAVSYTCKTVLGTH